jgi:DNA-directed RNA polymerase specialized sigma24 family protein
VEAGEEVSEFPETRVSAVIALRSDDEETRRRSLERLFTIYYRPAYTHLRCKWRRSPEASEDLLHDFFARAVEKGFFALYEIERGRFRTFLRVCLDRFVLTAIEGEGRKKRGGDLRRVAVDSHDLEATVAAVSDGDVEDVFDREWVRSVFAASVGKLKEHYEKSNRAKTFEAFRLYDLDDGPTRPSYADVGKAIGATSTDVTNYLHAARKELRRVVLETLREVTVDEEEFREEARAVLGVEV